MKTHLILIALLGFTSLRAADPLPSWDENAPEKAIVAFVEKVTKVWRASTP